MRPLITIFVPHFAKKINKYTDILQKRETISQIDIVLCQCEFHDWMGTGRFNQASLVNKWLSIVKILLCNFLPKKKKKEKKRKKVEITRYTSYNGASEITRSSLFWFEESVSAYPLSLGLKSTPIHQGWVALNSLFWGPDSFLFLFFFEGPWFLS